nr:aldehyde dehydrogenase family protein [Angustibacter aerolatus]
MFVDGAFVDPASGSSFKTVSPATEEVLAEVAEGGAEDVDRAVRAARRAYEQVWSRLSGIERSKYLFRIARILQERAREPGGARDPRQRQADQGEPRRRRPARRAVVLPPRRVGRQARARRLRRRPEAGRCRRSGDPLELPAAHAGLEGRAGAGLRQHGGAEARRDDPAERAAVRRDLPAGRACRPAWSTSSPARAPRGRRSSSTPTSTRSRSPARPRSASRSPARSPAPASA